MFTQPLINVNNLSRFLDILSICFSYTEEHLCSNAHLFKICIFLCLCLCMWGIYIHVLVCLREYIRYVMSNTSHPEEDSLLAQENVVA